MTHQICYEDVDVDTEMPILIKRPTSKQLVMWAGVTEEFNQIHYDKDFALSLGLPGVVVQGRLIEAFFAQLITDWIGERANFKRLSTRYQGVFLVNEDVICKGKVLKKFVENNDRYVECEIWAENTKGEKCALATALVILPTRENIIQL